MKLSSTLSNRFTSLEDMKKRIRGILKKVDAIHLQTKDKKYPDTGNTMQEDEILIELVQDVFFYLDDVLSYVKDCLESDTYHSQSLEILQTITDSIWKGTTFTYFPIMKLQYAS